MQMGSVKELVISTPAQLQDYLHKAEQGRMFYTSDMGENSNIERIYRSLQAPKFELWRLFWPVSLVH